MTDRGSFAGPAASPTFLAAIIDSVDDAIHGQGVDGTILSWNVGAERMYGYRADEIVGKPISILVPPDRQDEVQRIIDTIAKGESVAVVESVKAASDIYSPVSGAVTEGNTALAESPGDINADPMGKGWIFKIKLASPADLDGLMDQAAYDAFVKSLG